LLPVRAFVKERKEEKSSGMAASNLSIQANQGFGIEKFPWVRETVIVFLTTEGLELCPSPS
jgi:hypothetical protein